MPILRLTDPSHLPDQLRGAVVAIGNFDGVHRGHQAVLGRALEAAELEHKPSLVLTFDRIPAACSYPIIPSIGSPPPPKRLQYSMR